MAEHVAGPCPVVAAFERRVDADPRAPAVVLADRVVRFGELDAAANGVARALTGPRGGRRGPVALMVLDPARMLAAMLGTLKAGCFYAPVDPLHPVARNRRLLARLGPRVVVTDRPDVAGAAVPTGAGVLDAGAIAPEPRRAGPPEGASTWGYVLFTSGSTGEPKGIAQSRRDMLHNVRRHAALRVGPSDRVSLLSADGFVAAVSNVYVALLAGAALVPYAVHREGAHDLVAWLGRHGVTVLYTFPSFLRQAAAEAGGEAEERVRLAYLGGEPVFASDVLAARALLPAATVAVGLNSTETGLTRLHLVDAEAPVPDPVPVGLPVPGVETVVLDGEAPAPPGTAGEIVVRSAHVDPALLRDGGRFERLARALPGSDVREFRTGDRGRIEPGGELVHLGRADGMVKVRGFRVEIGEVEAALAGVPGVREAAVVPARTGPTGVELAAHLVAAGGEVTPSAVRRALAERLPPAFVPARVAIVEALPRTRNGKVDRAALAAAAAAADSPGPPDSPPGQEPPRAADPPAGQEPPAPVEERLARLWCETLGLSAPAADQDFFLEGGTSISALGFVSRVRKELGVPLPLAVLFDTPTFAAVLGAVRGPAAPSAAG